MLAFLQLSQGHCEQPRLTAEKPSTSCRCHHLKSYKCVLQVVAANREVEATNAKRAEESERSLQALRQKGAGDYSKQVIQISKPVNLLLPMLLLYCAA